MDEPHIEIAFTDSDSAAFGFGPLASITERSICDITGNPLGIVFASIVELSSGTVVDQAAQTLGAMAGLRVLDSGRDIMSWRTVSDEYIDEEFSNCGINGDELCRCSETTQNSFAAMIDAFGTSECQ